VEVGNPEVVAVGDLLVLVDAGESERETVVRAGFARVHFVHVERGIGHHEIAVAPERFAILQTVGVRVVSVGISDIALETVDREVHAGEADGGDSFFVAEEGDAVGGILLLALDEVAALDEHAAGAAGGVEDDAVLRLDYVDDGLDEGRRGEELAGILRALHTEPHEELFVDAAEDVASGGAQSFRCRRCAAGFRARRVRTRRSPLGVG